MVKTNIHDRHTIINMHNRQIFITYNKQILNLTESVTLSTLFSIRSGTHDHKMFSEIILNDKNLVLSFKITRSIYTDIPTGTKY